MTGPERFATMVTCIDGRIQRPLDEWVRQRLGVEYLDTITEPGPESMLATTDERQLGVLLAKVAVSRRAHGSATLVIAGHADCAGNPVSADEHRDQLRRSLLRLTGRLPGTRILAVHAARCGERCWAPELVAETPGGPAVTHD
ncbi:carbonic anhydrase [Micromonospora radicis]|uniref:carbonic anhydrase n=1 Tax=Micromonospora radicis TaxID=1894971 RepID=UPI001F40DFD0|nr:carbonic anhydrase [Micromonospora radicis]